MSYVTHTDVSMCYWKPKIFLFSIPVAMPCFKVCPGSYYQFLHMQKCREISKQRAHTEPKHSKWKEEEARHLDKERNSHSWHKMLSQFQGKILWFQANNQTNQPEAKSRQKTCTHKHTKTRKDKTF